jgi:hypothetical protein
MYQLDRRQRLKALNRILTEKNKKRREEKSGKED